jgi:2-polyprenyl-3-methyl-5-hydroxy-6-metoxy-1,4-benzoquinol methylase
MEEIKCPICGSKRALFVQRFQNGYEMHKCLSCSVEFAWPFMSASAEEYEQFYERRVSNTKAPEEITKEFQGRAYARYVLGLLKYLKRGKLLDIGCGEGVLLKLAEEMGYEVYGCDISQTAIDYARNILGLRNLFVGKVEELPSNWKGFPIITALEVLEHLDNPVQFVRFVHKLLSPHGYFILSVPNYEYEREIMNDPYPPPLHLTLWTNKALELLLRQNGFGEIKFGYTHDVYPSALHLARRIFPKEWINRYLCIQEQEKAVSISGPKKGARVALSVVRIAKLAVKPLLSFLSGFFFHKKFSKWTIAVARKTHSTY